MKENKSLIPAQQNKLGIMKIFNNLIEIIKSKTNKNYILSDKSPESLKSNKELIIRTIKNNYKYLDNVDEEILMEELYQEQLPIDGIIDTAFKSGYIVDKYSDCDILRGEKGKNAITRYIEMQETDKGDSIFKRKGEYTSNEKISLIIESLNEDIVDDKLFMDNIINMSINKGYKISINSPSYLKNNTQLAEKYYNDLLENNIEGIESECILSPKLINNEEFLKKYIKLLQQKGIGNDIIINTLTHNEECTDILKNNGELFGLVFEQATPQKLDEFFEKFYKEEEIEEFFSDTSKLEGKLLRVGKLYNKDNLILHDMNGDLLSEKYKDIAEYKLQIMVKDKSFQDKLASLNDYKYYLYNKMAHLVDEKTGRWNNYENNIVSNLADGYYEELIEDLYKKAKEGNKINSKDIEVLTNLMSVPCIDKSFYNDNRLSNNTFNITNKSELEHYDDIKEIVCDSVLVNSTLDDMEIIGPIKKYLEHFENLSEIDRIKLALLQKNYNIGLNEAKDIYNMFSSDLENIPVKDEQQESLIEQLKGIKNTFECGDIDTLKEIGNLDMIVQTDISVSTFLVSESRDMYDNMYKENLYMPKENEKIDKTTYEGKDIDVFEANSDFSMIVKRIDSNENNSKEIWNKMVKNGEYNSEKLRYNTCTSYMTNENLLNIRDEKMVILGFSEGVKDFSFSGIYTEDAHTPFYTGDTVKNEFTNNVKYMIPASLETETDNNYNEIVINTIGTDKNGNMTKMQPDYIVYIKEETESTLEDLENDDLWLCSKKTASEFGIPIVIIDKEKVMEKEKSKIAVMSEELKGKNDVNAIWKFYKKAEHYIARYGEDSISEYAHKDKRKFFKDYVERKRAEEIGDKSIPNIETDTVNKDSKSKQDVLKKQNKLIENNIISGDER